MDFINSGVDINSYVARYMDEMGCSFQQACEDLGINENEVFNTVRTEEMY
ncbi:hypothetical protein [Clostridium sp. SM-530-WT-3G]|nr:hypothetical protein [Clostridium sp. SM-530-WT-3G]NME84282.1 hypothetical protein [Clostridium sp. SM-530-WT-3G]